jgi:hypothetical protein
MTIAFKNCARALAWGLVLSLLVLVSAAAEEQPGKGSIKGQVTDPSSASVPGAVVTLVGPNGFSRRAQTNTLGQYQLPDIPAGQYNLRVSKTGFAVYEMQQVPVDGPMNMDVSLTVAAESQQVTVSEEQGHVSVDPDQNAGSLVLKGADLEALSDDPDQLADDLQALAGPSAGPNGGQIFIDGFSGGRLPPKASIREIRINQNPFSAEYDRLGFGRIEILTKPGTDKFRGQILTNFSDNVFNARNPFLPEKSPYQARMINATLSGPVTKKSSFTFDVESRYIDDNAVINATILDTNLEPTQYQAAILAPQRRFSIIPKYDYQINDKNTLTLRYHFSTIDSDNQGVGAYSLPSRAYNTKDRENTFQLTETAILSTHVVNETRFQFNRQATSANGDSVTPTTTVLDAFTGGGSNIGLQSNLQNHYEFQNLTTWTIGRHTLKIGGRLRIIDQDDVSPTNFAGTFSFAGGIAPQLDANNQPILGPDGMPVLGYVDSIERYRRTELFLQQGLSPAAIRLLGGGASQFTLAGGQPLSGVTQTDVGVFLLDDWRVRPNLTLSGGIRYETQTNIHDYKDFAPRLSFAWGIGKKGTTPKTVLRGGFGIFYDRFSENYILQAERYNGLTQQQYVVLNPNFYPLIPPIDVLAQSMVAQTIRLVDSSLRAPYILQTAIGVDRQLPKNTSISVNYTFSRGVHMLRSRNINAPLADGSLPYGDVGNLFQYESTGFLRQNQVIVNINSRASRRLTLFGFYVLNYAKGDTDGAASLPANNYNLHSEWGSNIYDVRHRMFVGGSVTAPWHLIFSPFITASAGAPFNITTGRDNNEDTTFVDRPAFADTSVPGAIPTPWGTFNPTPGPNAVIIPRNYGRGPAQFSVNLRASRTWGFGKKSETAAPDSAFGPGGGGPRGGGGGGRGPGGMMGGMGGGRGGPGGMFGAENTGKRFNLTLSVSARNLLNRVNLAPPVGNLGSSLFGESTALASGFGPGGASAASNRRIDLQLRFTF